MTSQEQLQEDVRAIAMDLDAVAEGRYNFWTGEIVDADEMPDFDGEVPEEFNNDDNYESDFDGGFARYFEDALDIEYRVDAQFRYKGAIITVAVGGPSIYVDTFAGEVQGLWGCDKARANIWRNTVNKIDDLFEEYFECLRG